MNTTPDIETFVGDTSPDVEFNIVRGTAIVPLSGCTIIFKLYNPNTGLQTNLANQTCTISDAANGKCIYIWRSGDKPQAGIYRGFVQVTFPTGETETQKVRVDVQQIGF